LGPAEAGTRVRYIHIGDLALGIPSSSPQRSRQRLAFQPRPSGSLHRLIPFATSLELSFRADFREESAVVVLLDKSRFLDRSE
jgi:hypothetical protein